MLTRRAHLRSSAWGLVDQAALSLGNFLLAVAAARQATPPEFGRFGMLFIVYSLALGVARNAFVEPFVIRQSAAPQARQRQAGAQVLGAVLALGAAVGSLFIVAALMLPVVRAELAVMGVLMPGLLLQDAGRLYFYVEHRPRVAALSSLLWLALQTFGLFLIAASSLSLSLPRALTCWALSGAIAAAALLATLPHPSVDPVPLLRSTVDLWRPLVIDFIATNGTLYLSIAGAGLVGGLSVVGAIRGAQTLLGPLNVLFLALPTILTPALVRAGAAGIDARRIAAGGGLALASAAIAATFAALALPDRVGEAVLGPTWHVAQDVMLPIGLMTAAVGMNLGALTYLRSIEGQKVILRTRLLLAPLFLLVPPAASLQGPRTAAAGLAVVALGSSVVWWTRASRDGAAYVRRSGM